jgi:hypothetical protein
MEKSMFSKLLMTPAEEKQNLLEIANEQLRILAVLIKIYKKNPTAALETSIKEIKQNYDQWKKERNL